MQISHPILSSYPYIGSDPIQQRLFRKLKQKYNFSDDDDQFIYNINQSLKTSEFIATEAAACYYNGLQANQQRYFKIVKLTKYCPSLAFAGSTALSVLAATHFVFQTKKFRQLKGRSQANRNL